MTARTPGQPVVDDGKLVSTNPVTGDEVGRFQVADAQDVVQTVAQARRAALWWAELGFTGRRQRLLRYRSMLANRLGELAELVHRETGKPEVEAVLEALGAIEHIAWAARNAERVLRLRKLRGSLLQTEYSALVEYQPYGVVAVMGPWNYPVLTPMGSIGYALAAGNAVVFKPSEYTPAVGQWLVDRFAEVVSEQPVLQIVHGGGEVGASLCRAGADKVAFTGSTAIAKSVMAACAETLTPVLIECGGKDALIVDADADVDAAVDGALWGAMTNAGQTCVGIERAYVAEPVYERFVSGLTQRAGQLSVGYDGSTDLGPITMPRHVELIRRHITDALDRGGRAVLGGPDGVQPPYVAPTILVDVPEDAAAVCEETFGPTVTVTRVRDADEGVRLANASRYGLGGAVFSRSRGLELARRMRSGMVAVNSAISFAGIPSLPFGGVGDSGFGRVHGADGLREFARTKAIAKRRMRSVLPALTFSRDATKTTRRVLSIARLVHGRSR